MDANGVGGFKAGSVTKSSNDNSGVKKEKPGSMKGKKVSGKYKYPRKKDVVSSASDNAEKKQISERSSKVSGPVFRSDDLQRGNDAMVGTFYRSHEALTGENPVELDVFDAGCFDTRFMGVDGATGAVSHAVSLGIESYKLSKLIKRRTAFKQCEDVVNRWKGRESGYNFISVKEMKDFSKVAVLGGQGGSDKVGQLRHILGADNCRLSSDYEITRLVDNLIPLAGEQKGSKSSVLPKELRGQPVSDQLKQWRADFESKGLEYVEGIKNGRERSLDGTRLLKMGHQSKKLMQQFNAIVKPLGLHMNFSTPALKKFGESALASRHEFTVSDKQFHGHLKATKNLPLANDIEKQIVAHEKDASLLKQFADYELVKIENQKARVVATTMALLMSPIPLAKFDYFVRAGREFLESSYRSGQVAILEQKQRIIVDLLAKKYQLAYKEDAKAESLRSLLIDIFMTIEAKKDRADIKTHGAEVQALLDFTGAYAGTLAGIFAPGIGGLASDVSFGAAKMTAAGAQVAARIKAEQNNPEFGQGRVEIKAYSALKNEYHKTKSYLSQDEILDPKSYLSQDEILDLTRDLFDISTDQARLLFERSDDEDLVSAKKVVRLRFTNGYDKPKVSSAGPEN